MRRESERGGGAAYLARGGCDCLLDFPGVQMFQGTFFTLKPGHARTHISTHARREGTAVRYSERQGGTPPRRIWVL